MEFLSRLEARLDETFTRKVPFQMSPAARKSLAGVLWIVALIIGMLQLWSALSLWQAGNRASELVDTANYLSRLYGSGHTVDPLGPFFYVSLTLLLAEGIVMLVAVPGLRAFSKAKGWNYLFYALLLSVLGGLIMIFSEVNGGFGNLVGAALGFAAGGYLLFQARSSFAGPAHAPHTADTAAPANKKSRK